MGNNVKAFRQEAGLSVAQLAEAVGLRREDVQRIEANAVLPRVNTAGAISSVLGKAIGVVFPSSSSTLRKFQKELAEPRHVSGETYRKLREVGLEGDSRRHTLKVLLRGHQSSLFFPVEPGDMDRLFRAVQDEAPEASGATFIVFDSDALRVAINLQAAVFLHFLWDPAIGTVDKPADDSEESSAQAVQVFFNENSSAITVGAIAEAGADVDSDRNYLNSIFLRLDTGGAEPNERFHIDDEDGESVFLRAGDISLLTAPLWVVEPSERCYDPDDDEP